MPAADRGCGVRSWAETLRSPAATNETGGSDFGRWRNAKVAPIAALSRSLVQAVLDNSTSAAMDQMLKRLSQAAAKSRSSRPKAERKA